MILLSTSGSNLRAESHVTQRRGQTGVTTQTELTENPGRTSGALKEEQNLLGLSEEEEELSCRLTENGSGHAARAQQAQQQRETPKDHSHHQDRKPVQAWGQTMRSETV